MAKKIPNDGELTTYVYEKKVYDIQKEKEDVCGVCCCYLEMGKHFGFICAICDGDGFICEDCMVEKVVKIKLCTNQHRWFSMDEDKDANVKTKITCYTRDEVETMIRKGELTFSSRLRKTNLFDANKKNKTSEV